MAVELCGGMDTRGERKVHRKSASTKLVPDYVHTPWKQWQIIKRQKSIYVYVNKQTNKKEKNKLKRTNFGLKN